MGKIICLMGKSASGKDTIYKNIISDEKLKLKALIPYTTRPMREKEQQGREYHFVSEENYLQLKSDGKILEERYYDTIYGIWRYFTVGDKSLLTENISYLLIGTLETYDNLCKAVGKENILPIYIETDDGDRLERALKRERKQEVPKYTEMCRRFLADDEDFSEEKLAKSEITERFYNSDLKTCTENIKEYILMNL